MRNESLNGSSCCHLPLTNDYPMETERGMIGTINGRFILKDVARLEYLWTEQERQGLTDPAFFFDFP